MRVGGNSEDLAVNASVRFELGSRDTSSGPANGARASQADEAGVIF